MAKRSRFIGLDVHAATISVAVVDEAGPVEELGAIQNEPAAIRRLIDRIGAPDVHLVSAYEAGPTGYVLHRQLTGLAVESIVAAPSLIPRAPGQRIKTDRRDAAKLARLLRSGDLTPIWIPDTGHEALRDLLRTRDDAKGDLHRAKLRLLAFLLRKGLTSPPGVAKWSRRFEAWLNGLSFEHEPDRIVFEDLLSVVRLGQERQQRLEIALAQCAEASPQWELIRALQAMRGIRILSAITIAVEAGDLRRFPTARSFMAYTGLIPREHSSGPDRHRGPITRTGNRMIRYVLGQAAHNARFVPGTSDRLRVRQRMVSPAVVAFDRAAQRRLHSRYRHLLARIGRPKTVTAVARELAGFVWAVGQLVETERAA